MAEAAFEWARGLVRINPSHWEEAKVVLGESFSMKEEQSVHHTQQVRMDVEESCQHFITFMYRSKPMYKHIDSGTHAVARYLIRTCWI